MSVREWTIAGARPTARSTTARSVTESSVKVNMFAILGLLMAALEVYAWLFRPNSFIFVNPITIGLPIVIAAGVLKRPANERAAILTFAAMLAVSLNRALIAPQLLGHVLVFGGAIYLVWSGYRAADLDRTAFKRLAIAVAVTVAGFLLVWAWHLR
jgi:hypothetical protein